MRYFVGRNKTFRAQARTSVSGVLLHDIAGNATTRYALIVIHKFQSSGKSTVIPALMPGSPFFFDFF